MVGELRWILLGLSAVLLVGIWWWGARRSRQAPGNAELRETTALSPRTKENESREWGVSPFEPLSIRTTGFEEVSGFDHPMTATAPPLTATLPMDPGAREVAARGAGENAARGAAAAIAAQAVPANAVPVPSRPPQPRPTPWQPLSTASLPVGASDDAGDAAFAEPLPDPVQKGATADPAAPGEAAAAESELAAPEPPKSPETQRIVTLRVCPSGDARWPGADLLAVLEAHGLAYGRYKVFHRKHNDGRTLFCAASLVEPGTFDMAKMPTQEFRGLTLFAVLPGPADALQTVDALIAAAVELAAALQGVVQDSKGALLSVRGADALREEVARFQAALIVF